ncbi:hypothetical protein PTTG_07380 [Puccinia triticina 1-1 BBBD Race 1]|uniref:Sister chromatid cohesion protein PDS5 n=1 Tax=Puccinia triticina (isolate 1-1 / race 1 (BBBD)) TaxID=630390 RepID=A0A180H6K4_PUCT1|nr:hypothetical protein PTTG_07380 [Puccinia triticina 1-1 BBBD Race 1]WAR60270.1 hypothetical protein PtB15_9B207 [Puccinia triticina]
MDGSEASQPLSQRLKFKGALAKDSKVTSGELIKRLTALLNELKVFDQEEVDRKSLSAVRAELIQPVLIVHKDKTVKALVACCIANLLRLYAPDAPYTLSELRDIFQFFFRQLRNLQPGSSQCPNQVHYLHLLESLATVQSIVLVCDVPQSEELITEIFHLLFKMVNTEMSQNFLLLFADISVQIINAASPIIPPAIVKLLLEQFKPKQVKSNPAAYRLAIDICNSCEDRLKQDVCRYFNDLLVQASKAAGLEHDDSDGSEDDESDDDKRTRKSFTELEATHSLIKSVYQVCPGLLQSVIPQLEAELKKYQVQLRVLAVQTLGQMFSEQSFSSIPSAQTLKSLAANNVGPSNVSTFYSHQPLGADLARRYSSTWKEWTRRAKDLSPQVRLAVVSCLKQIISKQPHLNDDISALFKTCLTDTDDKVRCESCKVFSQLEFELVLHHLDVGVLKTLSGRIEDRKPSVQREALNALGRLYKLAQSAIEAENPQAITQFAWIPHEILSSMFLGDPRLCASAEKVFLECVAPFPSTTAEQDRWVDRLLNVTKYLDSTSMMKLRKFSRIGVKRPTGFDRFLDACEAYNGGVMNQNETQVRTQLADIMRVLSTYFPDSAKALEELHSFAKLNDRRMYKLFKTMSDEKADLSTLIKAHQEFRRKLKPLSPSFAETLEVFLHKSAYLVANSASVPILLERIKDVVEAENPALDAVDVQPNLPRSICNSAKTVLDMISTDRPAMLMMHVDVIVECITDVAKSNMNQSLADACLLALSSIAKADATEIPSHNDIAASMKYFAMEGTPLQAKQAAIVLVKVKGMETACREIHEELVQCLLKAPPDRVLSYLSALGQIVKYAPKIFDTHRTALTSFLLHKQILVSSKGDQEDDDDWIPDNELCDSNRARISALKVLVNRCIASANSPESDTVSAPVFKLLWQLIVMREKIGPAIHSYAVAARLRLKAAESIIKLATFPSFNKEVQKHFGKLVWISQDTSWYVRERFYRKLARYLQMRRLDHPRFNVLMYLAAPDPVKEIKDIASRSITSRLNVVGPQMRTKMFETTILYLLHALAHHDDFGTETRDMENFSIYIDFFVESVGNSENASLLYHLAGQLKTVKDRQETKHPEALYMLSELAQLVIRVKARDRHWVLPTYPGHVQLPDDLFARLSAAEALEVSKKDYLPEEFVTKFSLTKIHAIQKEREAMINGEPVGQGTRKTKRGPKPAKKRATEKKRRKLTVEEEEEDDEADKDGESEAEIIVARKDDRSKRLAARRRAPARTGHKSRSEVNTTDGEEGSEKA